MGGEGGWYNASFLHGSYEGLDAMLRRPVNICGENKNGLIKQLESPENRYLA